MTQFEFSSSFAKSSTAHSFLVIPAAIAGVTHYYMQVKADVRQPLVFALVLATLLLFRLQDSWRRSKPGTAAPVKPAPV